MILAKFLGSQSGGKTSGSESTRKDTSGWEEVGRGASKDRPEFLRKEELEEEEGSRRANWATKEP